MATIHSQALRINAKVDAANGFIDPRFAFARASIATRTKSDGTLETVAVGVPRFDWRTEGGGLRPALRLEPANTNHCLQSENFGAVWSATPSMSRTAAADTSVGVALDLLADSGSAGGYYQDIILPISGPASVSFFVRKGTAPQQVVYLYDNTAGAYRGRCFVTWVGSAPVLAFDNGGAAASAAQQVSANIWRCSFMAAGLVSGNTCRVLVGVSFQAGVAGNVYLGGLQIEAGRFPTSYLKTMAGGIARAADALSISLLQSNGQPIPAWAPAAGTLLLDFVTPEPSGSAKYILDATGPGTNGIYVYSENGRIYVEYFSGGAIQASSNVVYTPGTRVRLATAWAPNNFVTSFNGAAVVTDAAGAVPIGVDTLRIASMAALDLYDFALWPIGVPNIVIPKLSDPAALT